MTKDLLDKADFLHNLFDTIPSFIFIVDNDVRIHHVNAAASKLLGADKEIVLLERGGEALHCIHSTETPEGCGRAPACMDCVVRNSVKRSFQGGSVQRETAKFMLLHPDGTKEVHMMVTASPLRYEDREFCLLILEDVTKLKNAEEALRRHAAQLEAANQELESFSYSVSHDLKAPLRSVQGFSEALLSDHAAGLNEEGRDFLERIHSAGLRMNQLIDDLLGLSKVTKGELRRETVDLSSLAGAVADVFVKSFPDRDVEFVIAPAVRVAGDGRLLRIVLENLMGNSVKFTTGCGKARIEFGVQMQKGVPVYFVRDNGAGF
ncbi:MAG TPA: histidine kinase dimerization/phospho-acceptor domain-containing protein, partial [Nitrospirota bacterium]|nr:histidine kinase dimerization/phospho-acceptor domain-containing protein [Nitrospirota bacterium]